MKPKIVFLHGSGTNANIYQLQARKLTHLLTPHFALHFLDAPHPSPPGPGVLPFFEGCDPYLTWMRSDGTPEAEEAYWNSGPVNSASASSTSPSSSSATPDEKGGVGEVDALVAEVKKLGDDVVGVVGFSQGAKVGLEVVRRLEKEGRGPRVFVAVCGTVPFGGGGGEREEGWRRYLERGLVKAESVHLIGEADPWRGESEKLVALFEETRRRVVRFKGGHHMPLEEGVNRQVVRIIVEACREGGRE